MPEGDVHLARLGVHVFVDRQVGVAAWIAWNLVAQALVFSGLLRICLYALRLPRSQSSRGMPNFASYGALPSGLLK